jgi:hypothetical protein
MSAMSIAVTLDSSDFWPSWKEFEIHNVSESEMISQLGAPNAPVDEGKSRFRWQVRDGERRLVVWDYFKSSDQKVWSAWGNHDLAEDLFGRANVVDLPVGEGGDAAAMSDLYDRMGQKVQDRGPLRPPSASDTNQ